MARLVLLGPAAAAAGTRHAQVVQPTVGAITDWAASTYGAAFAEVLGRSQVWVNGEPSGADRAVGPDDEVAVIPPFSGG